jgi:hypothetical protein
MPKLRMRGAMLPFPIRLHAVVFNQASTGTILFYFNLEEYNVEYGV